MSYRAHAYLVRPKLGKIKIPTLAAAHELADEFKASLTATLIRIVNEDCFPIVLVCHVKDRRRGIMAQTPQEF